MKIIPEMILAFSNLFKWARELRELISFDPVQITYIVNIGMAISLCMISLDLSSMARKELKPIF